MHSPSSSPGSKALPRRLLLARLSAHGDVIHTLPLLAAIKRSDSSVYVGWLVEASAASLLENHPLIDRLHVVQRKRWLAMARNPLNWPQVFQEIAELLSSLRASGYEASLDVQGLLKSAIWPFLAGIPKRYGFQKAREQADMLYTHRLAPVEIRDHTRKAVDQFLDLARAIGCPDARLMEPEFVLPPVSEASRHKIAHLLAGRDKSHPLVVLAPFTRWESKHWRSAHWRNLLEMLRKQNVSVALLGASSDQTMAQAMFAGLLEGAGVYNLIGKTDWPDLYALFEESRVLIGLDSAPLHIANAVGIPFVIGLYGPTAPGRTGPIGSRQLTLTAGVDCQPCFEHHCPLKTDACMHQLMPEQVFAAIQNQLEAAV